MDNSKRAAAGTWDESDRPADLPKDLRKALDDTKLGFYMLTASSLLEKAERKMGRKGGVWSSKESPNYEWAKRQVEDMLEDYLEQEENLVERLDAEKLEMDSKRRRVDPVKKPKSTTSAQMFFQKAKRDEVKKANPTLDPKEITKKLHELWEELSEEDRAPYNQQEAADKARFEREHADYGAQNSPETKGNSPKAEHSPTAAELKQQARQEKENAKEKARQEKEDAQRKKDAYKAEVERRKALPPVPVRPRSAYMLFTNSAREKVLAESPEIAGKVTLIMKKVGEMWKAISQEEKQACEAEAEADKKRFEEEKKAWEEKTGESMPKPLKKIKKVKKEKKVRDPDMPKRKRTAVDFYCMDEKMREEATKELGLEKFNMIQCNGHLRKKFNELPADDAVKVEFEKKGEEDAKRYADEMAAYKEKKGGDIDIKDDVEAEEEEEAEGAEGDDGLDEDMAADEAAEIIIE